MKPLIMLKRSKETLNKPETWKDKATEVGNPAEAIWGPYLLVGKNSEPKAHFYVANWD